MKKMMFLMLMTITTTPSVLACEMNGIKCSALDFKKIDAQYEIQDICELSFHDSIVPLTMMARKDGWRATEEWATRLNKNIKPVIPYVKGAIMNGNKVNKMDKVASNWWSVCNNKINELAKVWGQ
jgi:hypothetical protein